MIEYDVLTVGNAIVDVIARTDDAFLKENGIQKGSMTLIDAERATTLYRMMGPAIEMSGGSAANTAAGIINLGGTAGYIGKVSRDQLGEIFSHDIQSLGVVYRTAPLFEGPPTARCMILVTPDGERSMNTYLGACVELSPDDVDVEMVEAAKVTYFEGYLWDPPLAKGAIRYAAEIAHGAGRKVAMTLSDSFCVHRYREEFLDLIRSGTVDIVFANEPEVLALYETNNLDEALTKLSIDSRLFASVTLGEKGCVIVENERRIAVPATQVPAILDTTGAGDLFAAGFLRGFTAGYDHEGSARLGAIAAGQIIQQIGTRLPASLTALSSASASF